MIEKNIKSSASLICLNFFLYFLEGEGEDSVPHLEGLQVLGDLDLSILIVDQGSELRLRVHNHEALVLVESDERVLAGHRDLVEHHTVLGEASDGSGVFVVDGDVDWVPAVGVDNREDGEVGLEVFEEGEERVPALSVLDDLGDLGLADLAGHEVRVEGASLSCLALHLRHPVLHPPAEALHVHRPNAALAFAWGDEPVFLGVVGVVADAALRQFGRRRRVGHEVAGLCLEEGERLQVQYFFFLEGGVVLFVVGLRLHLGDFELAASQLQDLPLIQRQSSLPEAAHHPVWQSCFLGFHIKDISGDVPGLVAFHHQLFFPFFVRFIKEFHSCDQHELTGVEGAFDGGGIIAGLEFLPMFDVYKIIIKIADCFVYEIVDSRILAGRGQGDTEGLELILLFKRRGVEVKHLLTTVVHAHGCQEFNSCAHRTYYFQLCIPKSRGLFKKISSFTFNNFSAL